MLAKTLLYALAGLVAAACHGDTRTCGDLTNAQKSCVVAMTMATTDVPTRAQRLTWTVTEAGRYQLAADPIDGDIATLVPTIQVEDRWGLPMNIPDHFKTTTKYLDPGTYQVYVWSAATGPERLQLSIERL